MRDYFHFFKRPYPPKFHPADTSLHSDATGTRLLLKHDGSAQNRLLKFLPAHPRRRGNDQWNPRESSSRERAESAIRATPALNGSERSFFFPPHLSPSLPVSRDRENGIVNYGCVLLLATSGQESFEWATQTCARFL